MVETERVRRSYDRIAARYDEYVGYVETILLDDGRRWVCGQARGHVLEIGVGTGRNLSYYPADVRLTGVDINRAMLNLAGQRAANLNREADLHWGDTQDLDFPEARFDTVVATLALSSIPDARRAVAEAWRVLRPGGRFLVLDFVCSPRLAVRAVQRLLEPLLVRRYGFHPRRDPRALLEAERFVIDRWQRSKWGIVARGTARKSAFRRQWRIDPSPRRGEEENA